MGTKKQHLLAQIDKLRELVEQDDHTQALQLLAVITLTLTELLSEALREQIMRRRP